MVVKMSNVFVAIEVELHYSSDRDKINTFIDECTPVILVDSLESLEDLGIKPSEVIMVKGE